MSLHQETLLMYQANQTCPCAQDGIQAALKPPASMRGHQVTQLKYQANQNLCMRSAQHLSHFQALSLLICASTHALEKSSQPTLRTAAEPLPSLLREGRHVQQSKACLSAQDSSRAAFRSSGCKHVHPLTNFAASSEPSMPMPSGLHKSFLRAGPCIRSQTSPHQANHKHAFTQGQDQSCFSGPLQKAGTVHPLTMAQHQASK